MDRNMEMLLFLGVIAVSFIATLIYASSKMQKTNNLGKTFLQSMGLNLIIMALGSLWWFATASDGLSQIFGVMYYGIAFIAIGFINAVMLIFMGKRGSV